MPRLYTKGKICTVVWCSNPQVGRGYCKSHYARWYRHGDPLLGRRYYAKGSELDRIKTFYDVDSNGCWIWNGAKSKTGHGNWLASDGKHYPAYRRLYEMTIGSVPKGLQLDHICRIPSCVNPNHLEPVTAKENQHRSPITLASINISKTHCPMGHEYTIDNTYYRPKNRGRKCRRCNRERWQGKVKGTY